MRAAIISGPCPGFGIRECHHCKKPWISSASELCPTTNTYCPHCIPLVARELQDWELNPDRIEAERRIQRRIQMIRKARQLPSVAYELHAIKEARSA